MAPDKKEIKNQTKPTCVGMIMDGNRRWAKEKNLHSFQGHRFGYNKMKEVADWLIQEEIPNLVLYAFSIENWQRTEEVSYLMGLIKIMVSKDTIFFKKKVCG